MNKSCISNTLNNIRNAYTAKHNFIKIPYSRSIANFIYILKTENFLSHIGYFIQKAKTDIIVSLNPCKFKDLGITLATSFKLLLISRPNKRVFSSYEEFKKLCNKNKKISYLLSTPHGIISHKQALILKLGGELLCSFE